MDRAERNGFAAAAGAHIALFGVLSLGLLSTSKPLPPVNDPIDVQLVEAVAPRAAAPVISTEAPAPTTAPDPGPPEEAAPALDPTPPAPKPEPTPAPPVPKPAPKPTPPAPAPKPAVKPAPPPKPAPVAKPQPAKPAPAKAALAAPAKPAAAAPTKATAAAKPGAGIKTRSTGALASNDFLKGITPEKSPGKAQTPRAAMTGAQANALAALIREQLKPFWNVPPGTDVDQLVTVLRVRLNKDGSLAGPPQVVETTGTNDSNRGYVRQHQDAARRALLRAAPLKRLPAEFYDDWKLIDIDFNRRLNG